jgi:hypothetical protein
MEAKIHERLNSCKNEDEMSEFLLDCVPVLREYLKDDQFTTESTTVMGVKVNMKKGARRSDILKQYMSDVEKDNSSSVRVDPDYDLCPNCNSKFNWIYEEELSDRICSQCGLAQYYLSDEVGFKEEQDMEKVIVYSYKRENHFNEWVSQFQAKESTTVPPEVIEQLRSEFKKQKIKDLSEITHEKVKTLLKKLDKSKYYEHVPYITTILNGIQPPTMSQSLEDKLRLMFHQIQKPFEKHKPPNRKNFLSYSYVLYKMCELLGEDAYLKCFPLLKSTEKLYVQDTIWKKICDELNWEFYKTI